MPVGPQQLRHVVLSRLFDVHGRQRVRPHRCEGRPTTGSAARGSADRRRRRLRLASSATPESSRAYRICWPSVDTPRSKVSVPIATRQPSPGSPTTRSASVRASSKNTSLNSESPVSWTIGRICRHRADPAAPADRTGRRAAWSPSRCGRRRSTTAPSAPATSTPSGR